MSNVPLASPFGQNPPGFGTLVFRSEPPPPLWVTVKWKSPGVSGNRPPGAKGDLAAYLEPCSGKRTHRRCWMKGKAPYQVFKTNPPCGPASGAGAVGEALSGLWAGFRDGDGIATSTGDRGRSRSDSGTDG